MALGRPVVSTRHILALICGCLFVIQLGLAVGDVPSTMVMQDIICREQAGKVSSVPPTEAWCLSERVQQELNVVSMGSLVSVTAAGALAAVPFGLLSGRFGRVPVLGASILGMLLSQCYAIYVLARNGSLPPRAVWAMGIPLLLGGGRCTAEAMAFNILCDVSTGPQMANHFQWTAGAVLLGQMFGLLLAQPLVKVSVWLPLGLSPGLMFLGGLVLVLFTPETSMLSPGKTGVFNQDTVRIRSTLGMMLRKPARGLLVGAVLPIAVATMQSDILLRFMPVQFHWSLPQSGLLLSLRTLLTILTLVVFIPSLSWLCGKTTSWAPLTRDKLLASISAAFFILGSLGMVMVKNQTLVIIGLCISALGSGVPTLCRAMLVAVLRGHNLGPVFGILAAGELLSMLACQVGMGWLFGIGLGSWIGLPFVSALVLAVIITLAVWTTRIRAACDLLHHSGDPFDSRCPV